MTYITNPGNKKEDAAIIKAMEKGRKTKLLTSSEKASFIRKLKSV
ncbi:MAG: hypothetical protein ABUT20_62260 [Bacteroidota bacterium]